MKRVALFLFLAIGVLGAQTNPPKYSAFVNNGSGWEPWSAAGAGGAISQPPAIALYCKASAGAPWTPCTGSGGGGGGGTVTDFTAGNLSPLFTTNVATSTTTPALTFTLATVAANTVFCNATAGVAAPTFSAACATSGANITALNGTNISTGTVAAARLPGTLAITNVAVVMPVTLLTANTCSSAATATMTGVTTASTFTTAFATDPNGVTGWGGNGGLNFVAWPTANTLNWRVCNVTGTSITPAAMTLNVGAR
ncbi:MAG TPA: hypothetical protein VK638_06320 [Edaphobacter sp.]|nr:hypothetical protein [Edaphobacter sp.]